MEFFEFLIDFDSDISFVYFINSSDSTDLIWRIVLRVLANLPNLPAINQAQYLPKKSTFVIISLKISKSHSQCLCYETGKCQIAKNIIISKFINALELLYKFDTLLIIFIESISQIEMHTEILIIVHVANFFRKSFCSMP